MLTVIIGGGEAPSRELFLREVSKAQVLIAADSGAEVFYKNEVIPHYFIGDMDSVSRETKEALWTKCIVDSYNSEKDYTDTEIAVRKAIELGTDEIVLLGCTGNRFDHSYACLGLLHYCMENKIKARIEDELNTLFMTSESTKLIGKPKEVFSIFAYGSMVEGLTIAGAKYPLHDYNLSVSSGLTVSNEFVHREVQITFKNGCILICRCK